MTVTITLCGIDFDLISLSQYRFFHVQLAAYYVHDFRHQATVNYDSIAANQTNEYKHLDVDTHIWC